MRHLLRALHSLSSRRNSSRLVTFREIDRMQSLAATPSLAGLLGGSRPPHFLTPWRSNCFSRLLRTDQQMPLICPAPPNYFNEIQGVVTKVRQYATLSSFGSKGPVRGVWSSSLLEELLLTLLVHRGDPERDGGTEGRYECACHYHIPLGVASTSRTTSHMHTPMNDQLKRACRGYVFPMMAVAMV